MGRSQSACLLFARGCLSRQLQADGRPEIEGLITFRGAPMDALRTPYAKTVGQTDPKNSYKPTAIAARERMLERKASGWWLGDRRLNYLVRVT